MTWPAFWMVLLCAAVVALAVLALRAWFGPASRRPLAMDEDDFGGDGWLS